MSLKLTSAQKKGLTKSERKAKLKVERAKAHDAFMKRLTNNEPSIESTIEYTPKKGEEKKEKVYTDPDKIRRVKEAKERQEKYDALSIVQKIEKLDDLLGVGLGAKKQREKLKKELLHSSENQQVKVEKKETIEKKENAPKLKAKERRAKEKKQK